MRKIPEKFVKFSLGLYQGDCADKTMYLPQTSLVMYRVGVRNGTSTKRTSFLAVKTMTLLC